MKLHRSWSSCLCCVALAMSPLRALISYLKNGHETTPHPRLRSRYVSNGCDPCPSSSSLPQVLLELLAGGKFHGHTTHSHPAILYSDPGQLIFSTFFAAGGAEVIAACSGTVKFLLPDLFWDVIKMFHGHLCQKKIRKKKKMF